MSTGKKPIKEWGGARDGAGRPPREGGTIKFCISVTKSVWDDARQTWKQPKSQLFDDLLREYVRKAKGAA